MKLLQFVLRVLFAIAAVWLLWIVPQIWGIESMGSLDPVFHVMAILLLIGAVSLLWRAYRIRDYVESKARGQRYAAAYFAGLSGLYGLITLSFLYIDGLSKFSSLDRYVAFAAILGIANTVLIVLESRKAVPVAVVFAVAILFKGTAGSSNVYHLKAPGLIEWVLILSAVSYLWRCYRDAQPNNSLKADRPDGRRP
jgi:hypothetical protein